MCVIIIKPSGIKMPSNNELKAAHICNNDGCGFISSTGKTYKGLDFTRFLKELSKVEDSEACIIHMRLATHGSVKAANCHPFNSKGLYFAHNGILSIPPRMDMTDSETAFRDILAPIINAYGLDSKEAKNAVGDIIGYSKFAFMKDGEIRTFGQFSKVNGLLYSNTRHFAFIEPETPKRRTNKPISWEDYLAIRYR